MVTKRVKSKRWTGYRSDLVRALQTASIELEALSGLPSDVQLSVDYEGGLEERGGLDVLERIADDELRRVKSVTVAVAPDPEARAEFRRAHITAEVNAQATLPTP